MARTNQQDADLADAARYYCELLRPVFGGRKFLHVGGVDVAVHGQAKQLATLGAERPFLIADSIGTGARPTADDAEMHVLEIQANDMVEGQRLAAAALVDLPKHVTNRVDAWDPNRNAMWLCTTMLQEVSEIAGRPKYAAREHAWTLLEDKVAIDAFWDSIGVKRAPSYIVPLTDKSIGVRASKLDLGLGTVWAADARDGYHGGSIGLRWVQTGGEVAETVREMSRFADSVRIMPFLEGVPVSIHGIVFPESVAVFRPVEMIVLRQADRSRFLYAGCSTWFDPISRDRDEMRKTARHVGDSLRSRINYRGPFTIDGVLTADGFMPTELNPRIGAGLTTLGRSLGELPLLPICWAVTQGEALDYRPEFLERTVVDACDNTRACGGGIVTSSEIAEQGELRMRLDGAEFRKVEDDEPYEATMKYGPGIQGGFLSFDHVQEHTAKGIQSAPKFALALQCADRLLGTAFGKWEAARNVRS